MTPDTAPTVVKPQRTTEVTCKQCDRVIGTFIREDKVWRMHLLDSEAGQGRETTLHVGTLDPRVYIEVIHHWMYSFLELTGCGDGHK